MTAPAEAHCLVTCVLYNGASAKVIRALKDRGITTGNMHHARASAVGDPPGRLGVPRYFEKEVLSVVVSAERLDEIMELVADVADLDRPTGGFFYVRRLSRTVSYTLPAMPLHQGEVDA